MKTLMALLVGLIVVRQTTQKRRVQYRVTDLRTGRAMHRTARIR